MRRAQRRNLPLDCGEIGHTAHANFAVGPLSLAQPLDQIETVLAFLDAAVPQLTLGIPTAAGIRIDHCVTARAPIHWIRRFECGVSRYPAFRDAGSRPDQAIRQVVFAVGTPTENRRKIAFAERSV